MLENNGTISLGVSRVTVSKRVPEPAAGITAVFINKLISTIVYKMISDSNLKEFVIIGAGGFGREVLWTIQDCNKVSKKYRVIGFIDDNKTLHNKVIHGLEILGGIEWLSTQNIKNLNCVIAIGDSKIRQEIVKKIEKTRIKFATIIHPSVTYSDSVEIGAGTVIQAGSVLTVDTKIGNHCKIDTNCTIAHDCVLDDYVTLNPGVHINGNNKIGTGTYVGSGVVTKEKIRVGKWSIIGAGTVLIENALDSSVYVGIPGKLKRKL